MEWQEGVEVDELLTANPKRSLGSTAGRHSIRGHARRILCLLYRAHFLARTAPGGSWRGGKEVTQSRARSLALGALATIAAIALCVLSSSPAAGQAAPAKQLMSEQAFKNVTVLKGIPVDEFMNTMGF